MCVCVYILANTRTYVYILYTCVCVYTHTHTHTPNPYAYRYWHKLAKLQQAMEGNEAAVLVFERSLQAVNCLGLGFRV